MDNMQKTSLKIALVCDWYLPRIGGIEYHLRDLALELEKQGHQVHLITPISGDGSGESLQVFRINARLFPFFDLVFTRQPFRELKSLLQKEKYDVVHCHFSYISPFASGSAYLSQKLGFPTVITFHSFLGKFTKFLTGLNHFVKWTGWPVVFSAVSADITDEVRAIGVNDDLYVLPNGVNPPDWKIPYPARNDNKVRVVSVMRLCRRKRPAALIGIIAGVRDLLSPDTSFSVRIIGAGHEYSRVEKLIKRHRLESIVALSGFQTREKIKEVFSCSDIFVLPTVLESFGISALEARCAGLPVVAMDHGGVKAFIRNGREGFLASDDQDMARRIAQLISDTNLRDSIAEFNRENAPSISWTNVIPRHINLYRQAIMRMSSNYPV